MESMISSLGSLRVIRSDELELMLSWRNAPAVRANMYTRHEISLDEHLQWWSKIIDRVDQSYYMYEFHGVPSGIVAFTGIDLVNNNSSWAFYASPDASRGTGSRMEFLALECAFRKMNLHKLCCEVLGFNTPVIRLHQKFGFAVEGVLREQHLVDGTYVDVHRLGLLSDEWLAISDKVEARLLRLNGSGGAK